MEARDAFSSLHPIICFAWFSAVILVTALFMHPAILTSSLVCAAVYALYLGGGRTRRFALTFLLPMALIAGLINPVFNHRGATTLFYVRYNPITLESVLYGAAAAAMIGAVILWFSCYNRVMTSDKFLYIFGRVIPALSLIISMALRFIPRYRAQIKRIADAQRGIGRDISSGGLLARAKSGMAILSIMMTWALENALDTADSMKGRGYGLKGRTAYSDYRFLSRDALASVLAAGLLAVFLAGVFLNVLHVSYFPLFYMNGADAYSLTLSAAWAAFCAFPVILDVREEVKWRLLRQRI
jgi:energy-coupling factor transport system permease protein